MRAWLAGLTALSALTSVPAAAKDRPRVDVDPYVEAAQLVYADLSDDGDVLTYSALAVGVDAAVATPRTQGQLSLRYEHLISYSDSSSDADYLSGLGRVAAKLGPDVQVEAGGLAARSRVDGQGVSPGTLVGRPDQVTQVYSVYAGPTIAGQYGRLTATAAYRIGYTKVDERLPGLRGDDDSVGQVLTGSVGEQPGEVPVGWAVGATYAREDGGALDQRFEDGAVRVDVTVPVDPTTAIVGGVGYEHIRISQRDILRDANGNAVPGPDGTVQVDPVSPRRLAYDSDGIIGDVGVLWRPSPRTSLEARIGWRYDSVTYAGSFTWAPDADSALGIAAYDSVTSYSNYLNDALSRLPTQFAATRNPLTGDLSGCAYGGAGTLCFADLLRAAQGGSFRARGVTASYSRREGPWNSGFALGYENRRYLATATLPFSGFTGIEDQSWFADAYLGRQIDARSSFGSNAYLTYYDPGLIGARDIFALGANASYNRRFYRNLSGTAAVALDSTRVQGLDDQTTASALLGVRYDF